MRSFIKNMVLVAKIFSPPVFIAVILTLYMMLPVSESKDKQVVKEPGTETTGFVQKGAGPGTYKTVCF